jgi:hypothetical protein
MQRPSPSALVPRRQLGRGPLPLSKHLDRRFHPSQCTSRLQNKGTRSKDDPDSPMSTPEMVDLSDSPPGPASNQSEPVSEQPEPVSKSPVWGAEPSSGTTKSASILSILKAGQKPTERQNTLGGGITAGADADMGVGDGASTSVPTPTPKLISLTAGSRTEDANGKRLRATGPTPKIKSNQRRRDHSPSRTILLGKTDPACL